MRALCWLCRAAAHEEFRLIWGAAALAVILNSVRVWLPRAIQGERYSPKHTTRYDYWALMLEVVLLGVLYTISRPRCFR